MGPNSNQRKAWGNLTHKSVFCKGAAPERNSKVEREIVLIEVDPLNKFI